MSPTETTATTATSELPLEWKSTVIIVLLASVVIFTTASNLLVLISFYLEKKLRNTFTFFVANLAVTDFLMGSPCMIFYTVNTVLGYWPFGQLTCGIWLFVDAVLTGASIFTFVMISVDRFWAVTWCFSYKKHNKKGKATIIISCIWVVSVIVCLPAVVIDRLERGESNVCFWDPSSNKAFAYFLSVVVHHLSCAVILFCYIRVCLVMRAKFKVRPRETQPENPRRMDVMPSTSARSERPVICNTDPRAKIFQIVVHRASESRNVVQDNTPPRRLSKRARNREEDDDNLRRIKQEKKIFVTVSCIVIAYVICWVPFNVMFTLSFVAPGSVSPSVFTFGFWMTYLYSVFNPLLYAFSNKDFRKAVVRVVKCGYLQ